jgi:imidazolonepropionase
MQVDLLIQHAAQVLTCTSLGAPKRGAAMGDTGLIPDGAVAIRDGKIIAVGTTSDLNAQGYTAPIVVDGVGKVVCPGFVDCHTHLVYAGDRLNEFEQRIRGVSYMDILRAGGGILSTVRATREAPLQQLIDDADARLDAMLELGTTTVEAKTGYGLDTATELKQLDAIAALDDNHEIDLVPTFLGAHAVPPEYKGRPDDYVNLVIQEMLPAAASWYRNSTFAARGIPFFADVFCETNVFTREQSARILEAARSLGLLLKAHVDEFTSLGGVTMAAGLNAVSVDHLDVTGSVEIAALAASKTIGVVLPAVNFNLGSTHYANARVMIDAGAALALATDLNPGSAPCLSMPLVMAMACRYQRLTPAEALNASTINAAYAIGLGNLVGSLEVGKQADLLVMNTPDYRQIMYQLGGSLVKHVIKKGILL